MNITTNELIERIEFGIKRLQEEDLSAEQQAGIFRAIASISRKRYEQLDKELKLEPVNG